jgi:hypothetical protein
LVFCEWDRKSGGKKEHLIWWDRPTIFLLILADDYAKVSRIRDMLTKGDAMSREPSDGKKAAQD